MSKDQFDLQAEQLLPCQFQTLCGANAQGKHYYKCSAYHRPEVAAALRKQAWINDAVYQGMKKENDELRMKLSAVRAERDRGTALVITNLRADDELSK